MITEAYRKQIIELVARDMSVFENPIDMYDCIVTTKRLISILLSSEQEWIRNNNKVVLEIREIVDETDSGLNGDFENADKSLQRIKLLSNKLLSSQSRRIDVWNEMDWIT